MEFEDLKTLFQQFNRKERYHLVHYACGGFGVSRPFKKKVEEALGISLVMNKLWMAMDYHLDWLSAITRLLESNRPSDEAITRGLDNPSNYLPGKKRIKMNQVLEGNQQDVDLLVLGQDAEDKDLIHLIMVEAKMDSAWTNAQIETKGSRIDNIFPKSGEIELPGPPRSKLKLHLLLMDKEEELTKNLTTDSLPTWAGDQIPHIQLPLATGASGWPLFKPVRKDKKPGSEKEYKAWQLELVKGPKPGI